MSEQSDERAELIRLRAEVAALRAAHEPGTTTVSPAGHRSATFRNVGATVLIVLGCVLAPVSVVATWLDTQVTDTDAYVETVAPLIEDPSLQLALSRAVTAQVVEALDVEGVSQIVLESIAGRIDLPPAVQERITGLATPMADGISSFLQGQVETAIASDAAATEWTEANRVVHAQLVATLTGESREGVEITDGRVTLDIAPFVEVVKERLVDRGIGVAARIPEVHTSFLLFELPNLTRAQSTFAALDTLGTALPLIALAILAIGVLLAHGRRRALIGAGLGVAGAMLVLGAVLMIGRGLYLGSVPPELLPREPAATTFDTVVRFPRTGLRTVFVLAVIIAAAAYLTGPSGAATALRRGTAAGFARLRVVASRPGGLAGERVGGALATYRRVLRIGVIAVGAFAVLVMDRPTPAVVVTVLLLVLLVLVILEVLAAPVRVDREQDDAASLIRHGGGQEPTPEPP